MINARQSIIGPVLEKNPPIVRNPLLLKVFQELDKAGIRYCLLRGLDELALKSVDCEIDLLIDSSHMIFFKQVVSQLGFVHMPSWGHAPHSFFLAYDEDADIWLKLDVVTDLVYGRPIRCMRLDLGQHCLDNRQRLKPLTLLTIEDEFFTLLLHCILDKGQFRTWHQNRLKSLGVSIAMNNVRVQQIRKYCQIYLPSVITWERIIQALQIENWQWFIDQRAGIVKKIFWQHPATHTWRWFGNRVIRQLRPLLFMIRRHGISVALLAPDGAGKSTLAAGLIRIDHLRAQMIYMGGNSDAANINLPTTRWLKHRVNSLNDRRPSPKRLIFRGLNFINHLVEQWYRCAIGHYHKIFGRFVIYDRYTYDSYLAPPVKNVGKRLRRWLRKKSCPAPNLVLLLDAPGNILFQRKREHSPEALETQRQVFLGLQDKISNIVAVDATRSADDVRRKAISRIWEFYGRRCHAN